MAIRNILHKGDPLLRKRSREITDFNQRLWELLDDMHETLREADGAGLAAPQVGVLRRAILVIGPEQSEDEDPDFIEIVNPRITHSEGVQDGSEGCLSVPGIYGYVERPEKVTVEGQDRFGNPVVFNAEGFQARAFCHEVDHLDGKLFTDFVTEYIDPNAGSEE